MYLTCRHNCSDFYDYVARKVHRFCITGGFGQAETHNDYECNSPKRTNTWTEESIIKAEWNRRRMRWGRAVDITRWILAFLLRFLIFYKDTLLFLNQLPIWKGMAALSTEREICVNQQRSFQFISTVIVCGFAEMKFCWELFSVFIVVVSINAINPPWLQPITPTRSLSTIS